MKTLGKRWPLFPGILGVGAVLAAMALTAWSQTVPPTLFIKPLGTNNFSVYTTNSIGSATYDLLSTPVLANADYPWTWAAIGSPGETNFLVSSPYNTGFYRAILDTNAIPLWEAADLNNPSAGKLTVYIDNPANGAVIQ